MRNVGDSGFSLKSPALPEQKGGFGEKKNAPPEQKGGFGEKKNVAAGKKIGTYFLPKVAATAGKKEGFAKKKLYVVDGNKTMTFDGRLVKIMPPLGGIHDFRAGVVGTIRAGANGKYCSLCPKEKGLDHACHGVCKDEAQGADQYYVVDAGDGLIALHKGTEAYVGFIPPSMKLKVVKGPAGSGAVGFYSNAANKYCTGHYQKPLVCESPKLGPEQLFLFSCVKHCDFDY